LNAVDIRDLHWRYPAFVGSENPWALQGVSLQIEQGEFFGITGTSGAGKTTICKFILGLIPHAVKIPMRRVNHHLRGSVSVLGEAVTVVEPQAGPHPQTGEPLGAITRSGIISPRSAWCSRTRRINSAHEPAARRLRPADPGCRGRDRTTVQEAPAMVGLQTCGRWPSTCTRLTSPVDKSSESRSPPSWPCGRRS
jgi:energy-coupling factor transporter ATP-binding protein EcfA2